MPKSPLSKELLAGELMTKSEVNSKIAAHTRMMQAFAKMWNRTLADHMKAVNAIAGKWKDGAPGKTGPKGEMGPRGPEGRASTVPGPKGDKGDPGQNADVQEAVRLTLPQVIAEIDRRIPLLGDALRSALTTHVGEVIKNTDFGPGGGTSFAIMQSGSVKVQQPSALSFDGAGAPAISQNQYGVTKLTFPSGIGTLYKEHLTDSGDHQNFTAAHTINAILSIMDGSGKGIPHTYYSFSGTTLTLTSPDANIASIGIFIIHT